MRSKFVSFTILLSTVIMSSALSQASEPEVMSVEAYPLISDLYTADPSAHVFDNKLYIYPSHDWESGTEIADNGNKFAMKDYHVYSSYSPEGPYTDHGNALDLKDIPWAKRQLWAPDAAEKNGKYYLYFPAKDKDDIFRIGVAVSDNPAGPFIAEPRPMLGSYSIDPAVFKDDDGSYYMYVGGIWGGQLQQWRNGIHTGKDDYPKDNEASIQPRVAKLSDDMMNFSERLTMAPIVDKEGKLIRAGDTEKRFFEASWMHKHKGKYYFSWSTGDTHNIAYGIGDSPYGPFVYQGIILEEVLGWTNHHSIVEYENKTYLFFHDSYLSNGATHLRNVKMTELHYNPDGTIKRMNAMAK